MIDKRLKLYLPFDDPKGDVAYDYSTSRKNGVLTGGAHIDPNGKIGRCLSLNGGDCKLNLEKLDFMSDFTISMYIKTEESKITWMLSQEGINKYLDHTESVIPNVWQHYMFIRKINTFSVVIDGEKVYEAHLDDEPKGLTILDHSYINKSNSYVDELRVYNEALSDADIEKTLGSDDVEYYIDGINFKEFGVYVMKSSGLVGRLARKEPLIVDWDNYHGIARTKDNPVFKERNIILECFIEATRADYVYKVNRFFEQFDKAGDHRLTVEYNGKIKPLQYEVELLDDADTNKRWSRYRDSINVGEFKLKLVEDEPVKKVLKFITTNEKEKVRIDFTSDLMLSFSWGDGTKNYNVRGRDTYIEHTYNKPGEYDIVVSGVIEDIEKFTTNAIIVWDLLK